MDLADGHVVALEKLLERKDIGDYILFLVNTSLVNFYVFNFWVLLETAEHLLLDIAAIQKKVLLLPLFQNAYSPSPLNDLRILCMHTNSSQTRFI